MNNKTELSNWEIFPLPMIVCDLRYRLKKVGRKVDLQTLVLYMHHRSITDRQLPLYLRFKIKQ